MAGSKAGIAIANVKANAEETVTKVRTEAEIQAKNHNVELTRVKAETEEMAKVRAETEGQIDDLTSQIAQIKAQAEEKQKSFGEQIDKSKAEANEAIAQQKAESESQTRDKEKVFVEQIVQIKANADQKINDLAEQIAQIKVLAEESQNAHKEHLAKLKAEVAEKQKAAAITKNEKSSAGGASETTQRIAPSLASLPGGRSLTTLAICARNFMKKELVWGNPEGSVQEALSKMEQANISYLLIGSNGVLEGIVTKSDLAAALSPYLKREFAKWRRPLDEATLQIKVKWIMSKPVRIIRPQTPLAVIMRTMSRFSVRALPVVDQQGKVLGLVTEAEIFKTILKPKIHSNNSDPDKSYPIKSAFPRPLKRTSTQPIKAKQPSLVPA
jgi:CBS domain-containing protein